MFLHDINFSDQMAEIPKGKCKFSYKEVSVALSQLLVQQLLKNREFIEHLEKKKLFCLY